MARAKPKVKANPDPAAAVLARRRAALAALAAPSPRGVLWHRPRGRRGWVRLGTYESVAAAADVLFREQPVVGGDFKAIPEGERPNAPGDDEDD